MYEQQIANLYSVRAELEGTGKYDELVQKLGVDSIVRAMEAVKLWKRL